MVRTLLGTSQPRPGSRPPDFPTPAWHGQLLRPDICRCAPLLPRGLRSGAPGCPSPCSQTGLWCPQRSARARDNPNHVAFIIITAVICQFSPLVCESIKVRATATCFSDPRPEPFSVSQTLKPSVLDRRTDTGRTRGIRGVRAWLTRDCGLSLRLTSRVSLPSL